MPDPRFFTTSAPLSLGEVAQIVGLTLDEALDPTTPITACAPLDRAEPGALSFLDNRRYTMQAQTTRATACLIRPAFRHHLPDHVVALVSDDPARAFAQIAARLHQDRTALHPETHEIAAGAQVDATARLGARCRVSPGAVIEAAVELGEGCIIGPNSVIRQGCVIGTGARIGANVTLSHTLAGNNLVVLNNAAIGQDGFGFALGKTHLKVPQLGRVVIGDDVEIGACTTVDRGAGSDTVIEDGSKIDNLVQIAHNVRIGAGSVIVGQVGISGSTKLGAGCMLGGQVGVAGHVTIGDNVMLAARASTASDLPGDQAYGGTPALPIAQWRRQIAFIKNLGKRNAKDDGVS